jgi:CHAT domain-containing protein
LSYVALAAGLRLEGWRFFALARQADMVVLSACNTEVDASGGDRISGGLSSVILSAGARRVIASQWDANDQSATDFMKAFYAAASGGGRSIDTALQQARTAIADRFSDPYFYGNFLLRTRDLATALEPIALRH